MMAKKKVLIPYPRLSRIGGGNGVAGWIIQALVNDGWRVTLATLDTPDFGGVDRFFGTALSGADIDVRLAPGGWRQALRRLPIPGAFIEMAVMERFAASLCRDASFELLFSANNEMSFAQPGLQYIHFPRYRNERPPQDCHWYHRLPGLLALYRRLAPGIAGSGLCDWSDNRALANSQFIAQMYQQAGGGEVEVVHPPVVGNFPDVPWSARQDRMVAVGRIHRSKRMLEMIEIVEGIRETTPDMEFWIVGEFDCDEAYRRAILQKQAESDWIKMVENPDRDALIDLLSTSRYGLHAMEEEHFGMGVAEMQEAGMIVFAPSSGGPLEILAGDSRVLFSSMEDAVNKIKMMLASSEVRDSLLSCVASRRGNFSTEVFCSRIQFLANEMV